ncbi:MAG: thymidine phosphorylase [Pseudomonadota bacterium]
MDARSIIADVRDGRTPSREALAWFANGLASGAISDAQAGAFAMAVVLKGLSVEGRVALTEAMRDTGDVLVWDLPGPAIDKHSTGGVGDTVSLILAPMLAAAGAYVPMISGRGLGHTGGTLDKLEAIPGVDTEVSEQRFRELVQRDGAAIVAATSDLAPADKRLYAVRDVTGTVESVDLITASILSKKLAAGLNALVLDVKVGNGAFLPGVDDARALARAMVETAKNAGCATGALLTDMDQPLAPVAGNALEIAVVMDVLSGTMRPDLQRLVHVTLGLARELLQLAGLGGTVSPEKLVGTIQSGSAMEKFGAMVAGLGGPVDFAESWKTLLPRADVVVPVAAQRAGYVGQIDTRALGDVVVHLGGGRLRGDEGIDPCVGLSQIIELGSDVAAGDPLAIVHAADRSSAERAVARVLSAIEIADVPAAQQSVVIEWIA